MSRYPASATSPHSHLMTHAREPALSADGTCVVDRPGCGALRKADAAASSMTASGRSVPLLIDEGRVKVHIWLSLEGIASLVAAPR
jgi:hypothetical protein